MGGDHGPSPLVDGAIMAAQRSPGCEILLVGDESVLRKILKEKGLGANHFTIVHASEVVGMDEKPKGSLRKKNSSISVAARVVSEGKAEGVVSAGNTGASVAATLFGWRPLVGVSRPAIATLLPTPKHPVILLDVGANVDCKPRHLFQFAVMGMVYARDMLHRSSPRVGLLSIGSEERKGNEVTLETAHLLKASNLNYGGNAEGRDILGGKFDVVVCDGFVGNIVLKFGEALAEMIIHSLKGELSKNVLLSLGALAMKPALKAFKKKVDYAEYGGAPLLGLNHPCIICHGASNPKAIMNAIRVAADFASIHVTSHIEREIATNLERIKQPEPVLEEKAAVSL